jgi:hypothetical protein
MGAYIAGVSLHGVKRVERVTRKSETDGHGRNYFVTGIRLGMSAGASVDAEVIIELTLFSGEELAGLYPYEEEEV